MLRRTAKRIVNVKKAKRIKRVLVKHKTIKEGINKVAVDQRRRWPWRGTVYEYRRWLWISAVQKHKTHIRKARVRLTQESKEKSGRGSAQ